LESVLQVGSNDRRDRVVESLFEGDL